MVAQGRDKGECILGDKMNGFVGEKEGTGGGGEEGRGWGSEKDKGRGTGENGEPRCVSVCVCARAGTGCVM